MLTNRLLTSAAALALFAFAQSATDYDWEADLSVGKAESISDLVYSGSLEYFFAPLTPGTDAPWAELSFTDRLASLYLSSNYLSQNNSSGSNSPGLKSTIRNYEIGYNHRNSSSPHSVSLALGYDRIQHQYQQFTGWGPDFGSPTYQLTTVRSKNYNYAISYDYFLKDNWTVGASLTLEESQFSDVYRTTVSTGRLWDLANQKWVGIHAAITNRALKAPYANDDTLLFNIGARYYFNPRTGVSLGFETDDNFDHRTIKLGLHHYFTERLSATIGYNYTEVDFPNGYRLGPNGNTPDKSSSTTQAKISLRF